MVYLYDVIYVVQLHTLFKIALNDLQNLKDNPDKRNATYGNSNVDESDVSDSYASHAFNHLILNTGCPENVAGNIWGNNYIQNLDQRMQYKIKTYTPNAKFKFGAGRIICIYIRIIYHMYNMYHIVIEICMFVCYMYYNN